MRIRLNTSERPFIEPRPRKCGRKVLTFNGVDRLLILALVILQNVAKYVVLGIEVVETRADAHTGGTVLIDR
jgi:hypothetical protein